MSTFTEKIKIVVETVTGRAAQDLKDVGKAADDAGAKVGKGSLLDSAKGVFRDFGQAVAGLPGPMKVAGAAALGAGVALVKFAADSVSAGQDLAVSVGKFADATGLSTEAASRWIEVAGDMGIGSDKIEDAIGRMNKTVAASPQVFRDLGIEIARTKDGTIDVNATFLNTIARLQQIPDEAAKNKAAADIFGRGWKAAAELINTPVAELRDNLGAVASAKVINPEQVARSRAMRDAMDNLNDSIESIQLNVGNFLIPYMRTMAQVVGTATGPLQALNTENDSLRIGMEGTISAVGHSIPVIGGLTSAFDVLTGATESNRSATEEAAQKQKEMAAAVEQSRAAGESSIRSYDDLGKSWTEAGSSAAILKDSEERLAAQQEAVARSAEDAEKAERSLRDSRNASLDAGLAAIEAERKMQETVAKTALVVLDAKKSFEDKRDAVYEDGKAVLDYADAQAKANGQTLNATQRNAVLAKGWLDAAGDNRELQGEVRTWIARLNEIPADRKTEILAAIDRGDLAEAQRLLNSLHGTATVTARLDTAAFWEDYNSIRARVRNNPIAVPVVPGGRVGFAEGGVVRPRSYGRSPYARRAAEGMVVRVGEKGEEDVWLPDGSSVVPTQRQRMWALQNNTANFTVQAKIGSAAFEREVVRAIRKFQRTNGDMVMGTRH